MISDILSLYSFVNKELENASILKALFSWNGNRVSGSKEINIRLHGDPRTDRIWLYEVLSYKNFIFVSFPVNAGVYVDFGKLSTDMNPDSKYFRYVASPLSKFTQGGEENVKVDFVVFGYIPEDLITKMREK